MKTLQRSFASGEITPERAGLMGTDEYQTGLSECTNFVTLPHGPAMFRPGLAFHQMGRGPSTGNGSRLIPFVFSDTDRFVVEINAGRIYFHDPEGTEFAATGQTHSIVNYKLRVNGFTLPITNELIYFSAGPDCLAGQWYRAVHSHDADGYSHYWLGKDVGFYFNADFAIVDTIEAASVTWHLPTTLVSPWADVDLPKLHFVQSYDVLTITCPGYAPRTIRRTAGVWSIATESVAAAVPTNTNAPSVGLGLGTLTSAAGNRLYHYAYTVCRGTPGSPDVVEGPPITVFGSPVFFDFTLYNASTDYAVIATPAFDAGVNFLRIYRKDSDVEPFAFKGNFTLASTVYKEGPIKGHPAVIPPAGAHTIASFQPRAVGYHGQRKYFGGDATVPQTLIGTRVGAESSTGFSRPSAADDAVSFNLATLKLNQIEHIVSLSDLVVMTRSAIFKVSGDGGISQSNVDTKVRSYVGASQCQPAVVDDAILYAAERGNHIHEIRFSTEQGGQVVNDVSMLAPHLFNGRTVTGMALQEAPYRILWVVLDHTDLISLSYNPKAKSLGWHQHEIDASVRDVCVIPNGVEDFVMLSARRVLSGGSWRSDLYRFAPFLDTTRENSNRLDVSFNHAASPFSTVYHLWPLEGETVAVLGDGGRQTDKVVQYGRVVLDASCTRAIIGLQYEGRLKSLPLSVESRQISAFGQGLQKNVRAAILRVHQTGGLWVGATLDSLTEIPPRDDEDLGQAPELRTEEVEVVIDGLWQGETYVYVVAKDPLPAKVLSMCFDVEVST